MTILDLERDLIKSRQQLTAEQQSHDAEIRRIAIELGFPLGGVTTEQIIDRIREMRTKLDRLPRSEAPNVRGSNDPTRF